MAGVTRVIALVDLDDTLFQTRRKCPDGLRDEQLTALGFAGDGSPLSYASPRQISLLAWLGETTELIPVTARSRDALGRARVPHATAICAHGGVILEDGAPDPVWSERMAAAAEEHRRELGGYTEALRHAAAAVGEPVSARLQMEGDNPLYVLAKHDRADAEALLRVVATAIPEKPAGWTLHVNGNNAALLPPYLGKHHAVAHLLVKLRARSPDAVLIGIGDSYTDAPFMALCDFAALPRRSQLAERLFDAC